MERKVTSPSPLLMLAQTTPISPMPRFCAKATRKKLKRPNATVSATRTRYEKRMRYNGAVVLMKNVGKMSARSTTLRVEEQPRRLAFGSVQLTETRSKCNGSGR